MFGEGEDRRTHSDGVHGDVVPLAVGDGLRQLQTVVRFSVRDYDHHFLCAGTAAAFERL